MSINRILDLVDQLPEDQVSLLWVRLARKGYRVFNLLPEMAYVQALKEGGSDFLRTIACQDPEWACKYGSDVDEGPREDTRKAACQNPQWAYNYALFVDKSPHDLTREAACQDPDWALAYAKYVDKGPRDDTRKATCRGVIWSAGIYAEEVDKCFHPDTWSVVKGTAHESTYLRYIEVPKEYQEEGVIHEDRRTSA